MIEFFLDKTNGIDIIVVDKGNYTTFDENHSIINVVYKSIKENYSEAFSELQKIYGQSAFFKFLIVKRFLKCNFSNNDEKADIDENGFFELEFVSCPMRGECRQEGIICCAKRDTTLSEREIEIVKYISHGLTDFQISEKIFLSIHTVKNHRKNILHKTDSSNTAALITFATKNKLI